MAKRLGKLTLQLGTELINRRGCNAVEANQRD
jgi:hypothetical protein